MTDPPSWALPLRLACFLAALGPGVRSELSLAVSQAGLDALSAWGLGQGLGLLGTLPRMETALLTQEEPSLGAVAQLGVDSAVRLARLRLLLHGQELSVEVEELHVDSLAVLSALSWPLPTWPVFGHLGQERLHLNVSLPKVTLGLGASPATLLSPHTRLALTSCAVDRPSIATRAENYWLVGAGLSLGAYIAQGRLEDIVCDQVRGALGGLLSKTSSSIPVSPMFAEHANAPGPLGSIARHQISLSYRLRTMKIRDGYLAATLGLQWLGKRSHTLEYIAEFENVTELALPSTDALRDPRRGLERAEAQTEELLQLTLGRGAQLSLLLRPSFLNDFLAMVDVEQKLIEKDVPVTSEEIPERSRRFFSVMCEECFFKLRAWAWGPPSFRANDTAVAVDAFLKATLWMFNPNTDKSSPFIEFVAQFGLGLRPWAEDGVFRADVSLDSVKVDMDNSAFPADWDGFVQDLVAGMIHGMMWPEIQALVRAVLLERGLTVPPTCGVHPASLRVLFHKGLVGFAADLSLDKLHFRRCKEDFNRNFDNVSMDAMVGR